MQNVQRTRSESPRRLPEPSPWPRPDSACPRRPVSSRPASRPGARARASRDPRHRNAARASARRGQFGRRHRVAGRMREIALVKREPAVLRTRLEPIQQPTCPLQPSTRHRPRTAKVELIGGQPRRHPGRPGRVRPPLYSRYAPPEPRTPPPRHPATTPPSSTPQTPGGSPQRRQPPGTAREQPPSAPRAIRSNPRPRIRLRPVRCLAHDTAFSCPETRAAGALVSVWAGSLTDDRGGSPCSTFRSPE